MSIFPRRLRPGGVVTIHLGRAADTLRASWARASVIDPGGRRTTIESRWLAVPPGDLASAGVPRRRRAARRVPREALHELSPLHLAAEALGRSDDVLRVVDWFQNSTHWYRHHRIRRAAPLGRYEVATEWVIDGQRVESATKDVNEFYVEDVSVPRVCRRGTGLEATVRNHGPACLPLRIVELASDPPDRVHDHVLDPHESRLIRLEHRPAVLFWAEGREMIPLSPGRGPFCVRNPSVKFLRQAGGYFVQSPARARGYALDERALDIWLLADGFHRRKDVRRSSNADVYERMLRARLIQEVDW